MSGKIFRKTEPIPSDKAIIVQQEIINKINSRFPNNECVGLGSVGKKPLNSTNGDLDIGVKVESIEELYNIIKTVFSEESIVSKEYLYIVSIEYEWEYNKFVQVDFMFVKYIDYTRFRYYCPDFKNGESKYRTGLKIMFMDLLFNYTKERFEQYNNEYITKTMFTPIGLYKVYMKRKNIMDYYEEEYTHDVNTLVNMVFNNGKEDNFHSVEKIWDSIHSDIYKYPKYLKKIEKTFFVYCAMKGYTPNEINPYDFKFTYYTPEEIIDIMKKKYKMPLDRI